jgi:hypothetical protein
MKITVSSFDFIRNPAGKKQIIPKMKMGDAQSSGIKTYGKIMGWFRSHFGSAIELKDNHHVWYVKKGNLQSWAESQGAPRGFDLKQLGQVLEDIKKPVNVIVENKPGRVENDQKPETKEKPSDAEFHKAFWGLAKKQNPETTDVLNGFYKAKEEQSKTEIEALRLMIKDLENNPNKTAAEKKQLKEFHGRLKAITEEKGRELLNYLENVKIESKQQVDPAVREWMKKYQAYAKASGLELSEEKELQIVNKTIAELSSSKYKNLQTSIHYVLSRLTKELTEKLEKANS